jgi:putative FmdB family regulatory protein
MLSRNPEKADSSMPVYDVACSVCGYAGAVTVKISDLASWDAEALCPQCKKGDSSFRRVIKSAPSATGAANTRAPLKSSDRDDMRHKEFQRRNPDQVAAAIESVRKGENEGFT